MGPKSLGHGFVLCLVLQLCVFYTHMSIYMYIGGQVAETCSTFKTVSVMGVIGQIKDACRSWFSSSTLWILGIKLRLSDLARGTVTVAPSHRPPQVA